MPSHTMEYPAYLAPDTLGFHPGPQRDDRRGGAVSRARRLVGTHAIVGRCKRREQVAGIPTVPIYVAAGPRRDLRGRRLGALLVGTGVSEVEEEAWLKAVVEVVERYCLLWPHHRSRIVRASLEQVRDQAVPVDRFGLFSEEQYREDPAIHAPGPSEEIDWTWAYSLTHCRFVLVPAALAFPAVGERPPNNYTRGLTSTGVAAHICVSAAVLAGLYEVVERDAVMLSWLQRRSPTRLTVGPTTPLLRDLVENHFRLPDFEFVLVDLTADSGIPTVGCLALSDRPDRPAAVMGAASRGDPVEAARKALFETAQVLSALHSLGVSARSSMAASEVRHVDDHARYYSSDDAATHLSFLAASPSETLIQSLGSEGSSDGSDSLEKMVARLAGVGLEVLVVDLTTPDVGSCGYRAVKVLVPGTVDLNGDVRYPHLGSPRIRTVPERLGWPSAGDRLNLLPCPLA